MTRSTLKPDQADAPSPPAVPSAPTRDVAETAATGHRSVRRDDAIDGQPFAFELLSGFATAQSVFAAYEIGLWALFEADSTAVVDVRDFCASARLVPRYTLGICEHLAYRGVLRRVGDTGDRFALDERGRELIEGQWLAYVVFYLGGYRRVLDRMSDLANGKIEYPKDIVRDFHYVALGTEMMSRTQHHQSYEALLARIEEHKPSCILDVGCGSGRFLMSLMKASGAAHGIGVDLAGDSCHLARERIAREGYDDRVRIIEGDARLLVASEPELEGSVGVITALMILHEFLIEGRHHTARSLRGIARLLDPASGRLLILDKDVDRLKADVAPGYFTEYKLAHDFTLQDLASRNEWYEILDEAGLEVIDEEVLPSHTGSILFECRLKRS